MPRTKSYCTNLFLIIVTSSRWWIKLWEVLKLYVISVWLSFSLQFYFKSKKKKWQAYSWLIKVIFLLRIQTIVINIVCLFFQEVDHTYFCLVVCILEKATVPGWWKVCYNFSWVNIQLLRHSGELIYSRLCQCWIQMVSSMEGEFVVLFVCLLVYLFVCKGWSIRDIFITHVKIIHHYKLTLQV